jgi:hypothetical protein
MKRLQLLSLTYLTSALLAFAPVGTSAATLSAKNDALYAAAEPFEAVTEAGLDGAGAKTAAAVKTAEAGRSATRALLTPTAAARFDRLFDELTGAQAKKEGVAVAVQAAEIYKLLVSSVDASILTVPMEVSLLDYAGFRTNALLKAAGPDWQALAATAHEANSNWAKIRGGVTDQKLQAAMDRAQAGLASAAQKHNAGLGQSSAADDLNLVDALEAYFARN